MTRLSLFALAALMLFAPPPAQGKEPEIWFNPKCQHWRQATPTSPAIDFWDVFATPNTQWPNAQRHVNVVEMATTPLFWWAGLRIGGKVTDAQRNAYIDQPEYLPRVFKFLRDNHIALSAGFEVVHGPKHLEGVDPRAAAVIEAHCKQIQRDGGMVQYAGMDEPLCFGHYVPQGPRYSIEELFDPAKGNVQASIAAIKKYFPNVKFVQAEPINSYNWVYTEEGATKYAADFAAWAAAFKRHTGSPVSALHLDIWWDRPLGPVVRQFRQKVLRPNQIALGVMFNGSPRAKSDLEAMDICREHMKFWYAQGLPEPDRVLLQDWGKFPSRNLPETDPTAFASLANWYIENAPALRFSAAGAVGK